MWCIPPQQDARFVAAMEDVLEVLRAPLIHSVPLCVWMKALNNCSAR